MEKIPTIKLQELANMLYEEQSISLRNQLSAWATSNAGNPEHASLSSLSAMAEQSNIKDKILEWVSNITTPKPEFVYVPEIPAQMEEQPEEVIEVGRNSADLNSPIDIVEIPVSEAVEEIGIPEEVIEKQKKPRKKKAD